ncbi:MAG TPA: DegT/DnrJ/EryC1/StrS family aminotransferase [Candidatus Saccharimonadia bacterium]|nr:DegT/DnrJ/EryC1/StrS family aminotransferase [Candidatus Saccharimonadia bacterium]
MYQHEWPHITQTTKDAVMAELDKGEISIYNRSGIFEVFEDAYATSLGMKYALVINSGTAALHTAMVAAGFAPDDEVICPAYTFYATVTPIFQTGAVPILCEASEDGNIDPASIEKLITPKTKGVMVTHMWGMPCDMDAITAICEKHDLTLIEDCSHAHGALYKGKPIGSHGDISIFSLQGQKIITGGEGGILLTNNVEFYERSLLFGQYNKRCKQEIRKDSPYYPYAVTGFGLKLRAHPFAIAMANEQFGHLTEWHAIKHKHALYLNDKLAAYPELELPVPAHEGDEPSWYAYTFRIKPGVLNISTQDFCDKLIEAGIADADMPGSTCPLNLLRLFQEPALLFPVYANKVAYKPGDFPMAEAFFNSAIKLPVDVYDTDEYRAVLDGYVDIIGETLRSYRK